MKKILIVEDDKSICKELYNLLKTSNYEPLILEDFKNAIDAILNLDLDLILLDINIPYLNGQLLLQELRKKSNIPVIMVTAKTSEIDAVKGLDMGADDYITKPFGVMELVSRVKAILRRLDRGKKNVLRYKSILLDENRHTVLVDGAETELTYKEYEILKQLIRNEDIVLSRDRLMEIVWGYNFEQGNRTVDVHIQSLRKKLGSAGEYIKTIRNVGYKVGD